jgi:hypothetical protein
MLFINTMPKWNKRPPPHRRFRPFEDGGLVEPTPTPAPEEPAPQEEAPAPKAPLKEPPVKSAPPKRELKEAPETEDPVEAPDVKEPEKGAINTLLDKLLGDAPLAVRRFLKTHGDKPISNLVIKRAPIKSALDKVLDVIALGAWSKAKKKVGYDRLFHLFMTFSMGGKTYLIEKNQQVKISSGGGPSGAETLPVSGKAGLTLNSLIGNAVKRYGPKRIWVYDPMSTNCQMFLSHILAAQGLLTAKSRKFIYQDVAQLAKELPEFTKRTAKGVTDVAAVVDKALQFFSGGRLALAEGGRVIKRL